jgi:hypothetical protein
MFLTFSRDITDAADSSDAADAPECDWNGRRLCTRDRPNIPFRLLGVAKEEEEKKKKRENLLGKCEKN